MKKQEKIKFKQMIRGVSGVALFDMYVMYAKAAAQCGYSRMWDEAQNQAWMYVMYVKAAAQCGYIRRTWDEAQDKAWMLDTCAVELTARLSMIDKGTK